jgi:endonuclease/exonuclease/phosphatase family metal-dependent hydrolase
VIVAGDLNTRPPELARHLERYGFAAADVPHAFPAHAPRIAIDHVLTRNVDVARVRACPPTARPAVSDHRPVAVDVELPSRQEVPASTT